MKRLPLFILILSFTTSCRHQASGPTTIISQKPISFSDSRKTATKLYLKEHYGIDRDSIEIDPKIIVIHWTAIGTLDGSWRAFNRETLSSGRPDVSKGGNLNVSVQYLIDRDGSIFQLMPDSWMGRHVIGLNHCAIGIENVGGLNGKDDLTEEQLAANIFLVRHIKKKHPGVEYLIGHHEYRKFEGHSLWLEKDSGYRTVKTDPGDGFMSRLGGIFPELRKTLPTASALPL